MTRRTCSECGATHYARGYCRQHYGAHWSRGTLDDAPRHQLPPDTPLEERLRHHGWDVTADGCWEWRGSLGTHGYGQLAVGGSRPEAAYRAAYVAWVGPIPAGAYVCHTCDNRRCINPLHLFIGSGLDNIADMTSKDRHCRGERRANHKLSDDDVEEIRRRYAAGGVLQRELAAEYGVSKQLVQMITAGKRRTARTR